MLDQGLRYVSGPQWLGETVLAGREVLAVAGTHGKTTTTSLLAHLLESCTVWRPGFLVGGVPGNFDVSARLGAPASPFVIEADEYDTAFFDKRSKFVHYRPRIAILNNLEYDHADIFPDVAAIQRQFHHLVRIVPGNGRLIVNATDARLAEVLAMGCWTPVETFGIGCGDWQATLLEADGSAFTVHHMPASLVGEVQWSLLGNHSVMNALAALAAAAAAGADPTGAAARIRHVPERQAADGTGRRGRRRARLRRLSPITPRRSPPRSPGCAPGWATARILVALEPRSNSMRQGAHAEALAPSLADADAVVFLHRPELPWDAGRVIEALAGPRRTAPTVDALIEALRRRGAGRETR